jgi:hypothetical protein
MTISTRRTRGRGVLRTAALAVPTTVLAAGAAYLGAAPGLAAAAAPTVTPYAISASAYGSKVDSDLIGLRSAATAPAGIGCTKLVGDDDRNSLAASDVDPQVVTKGTRNRSFSLRTDAGRVLVRSTSDITTTRVGDGSLALVIQGLQGVSVASASDEGSLSASSDFTFADISTSGSDATSLPTPLQDLLNGPTQDVLDALAGGRTITVPGLGVIRLGAADKTVTSTVAQADSAGLEIDLYGSDQAAGGGDDSVVSLGVTKARLSKSQTKGLFAGSARGLQANAPDGTALISPKSVASIPCEGTSGQVRTKALAAVDVLSLNQLTAAGLQNRVFGVQDTPKGGRTGYTESAVDSVSLGDQLTVKGIVARARVVRTATGTIQRFPTQEIGSIRANGTTYPAPKPGEPLVIDGVAKIEVPEPVRSTYGLQVTGLQITLLGGSRVGAVISLANTKTTIAPY